MFYSVNSKHKYNKFQRPMIFKCFLSLKFKVIKKISINMLRVKIRVKRGKQTKQPFEQLMFRLDSCPAYKKSVLLSLIITCL